MWITIACGLDSQSRAGFWKNDGATVRAVRTIQYNNLLFYLLLIIIYYSSDSPSSLITESLSVLRRDCAHLLRKTPFTVLYDSSASGVASDFNALVTSDIIQSVVLWARGAWRKGTDLNRKLTFFRLRNCQKLNADQIRAQIRFENIQYFHSLTFELEGGDWSSSCPTVLSLVWALITHWIGRWVGPRSHLDV